jgi:catechol 2,3-dioxygenase-like lactoylglutathione lyase family enzyme
MAWLENKVQIGLVMRNCERMVDFYRNVLGLPYAGPTQLTPTNVTHYFDVGSVRIKLAELDPIPELSSPPDGWRGATGIRWITFDLDDLDAVVERCVAAGLRFEAEMQASTMKPGLLYAIVLDPDGNWVELVQRSSSNENNEEVA